MYNRIKHMYARTVVALVAILFACDANAVDVQREPMTVLKSLADRIYVLGETTGKVADMVTAEERAAEEVSKYVASGSIDGLLANIDGEQSPLAVAAYMGYPNVVAALLTSNIVRAHINDTDKMGLTPWIAANLSMKLSLWTCKPAIFDDPYTFVPMFVTQPYYITNPTPPYRRTREVLEAAGASADMPKAKEVWLTNCLNQSDEAKIKVQATTDLQKTVHELGVADFAAQIVKLMKKASEMEKK